jgi:hypothetical protein
MRDSKTKALGEKLLEGTRVWPERWQGDARDIPIGREIVKAMLPFLKALVASGLAATTLRRHFGNAWLLGGEIVRRASLDPPLRRVQGAHLLLDEVGEEGGPLLHGWATEDEQPSFDATCRRLWRFLRTRHRCGTAYAGQRPTDEPPNKRLHPTARCAIVKRRG